VDTYFRYRFNAEFEITDTLALIVVHFSRHSTTGNDGPHLNIKTSIYGPTVQLRYRLGDQETVGGGPGPLELK